MCLSVCHIEILYFYRYTGVEGKLDTNIQSVKQKIREIQEKRQELEDKREHTLKELALQTKRIKGIEDVVANQNTKLKQTEENLERKKEELKSKCFLI